MSSLYDYDRVGLYVSEITREESEPFILNIHYAKRFPSVTYAYGLFNDNVLIGCITYGTPPSPSLRRGIAGDENILRVLELNRLVLADNVRNHASFLISKSLKMLPHGKIIVSFADIDQGHNGCVYRASNFLYCGLSANRTDLMVRGQEHLHSLTISDEFRGAENRVEKMKEKYGDDLYAAPRSRKHRYIYVTGKGKEKKRLESMLLYPVVKFGSQHVSKEL